MKSKSKWRRLRNGEVLQDGDEWQEIAWKPTRWAGLGVKVGDDNGEDGRLKYRRRVK